MQKNMETKNKYGAREITAEESERQKECARRVYEKITSERDGGERRACCVVTYGCQQNEADGERIAGMAQEMGYTLTDDPAEADLIVVNTCAVRDHAEKKALSVTGGYKHLKAKNPALKIGV